VSIAPVAALVEHDGDVAQTPRRRRVAAGIVAALGGIAAVAAG